MHGQNDRIYQRESRRRDYEIRPGRIFGLQKHHSQWVTMETGANGPINALISNATLVSTRLGNCGPGEFIIGVETGGTAWTVAGDMGPCGISFGGTVTPPIKIVNR
jgi:hypothetical protein